ncbi:MAG: cytochrome c oxidase subunit 3 [Proteobacteria bacterium]|jgi:cytochrome c oxidase subunit 3|nr:cytochrome c oxidase subunit 3 [Pseudomonadota bacterium]MBK8961189.1 cytochrome c oxidase subunit 3 [Pseudomonadota bacterium]
MSEQVSKYYLPEPSPWPILMTLALFSLLLGTALTINGLWPGMVFVILGLALFAYLMFAWFGDIVRENSEGLYNDAVDSSFRQGMVWFIASEFFFFLAFFASLYYLRNVAADWLTGNGYLAGTNELLYNQFFAEWPRTAPGLKDEFTPMSAWGVPAINTVILLTSGATITWAHWGLKTENRALLIRGLALTIALGLIFVVMQAMEYQEAYTHLHLTLKSGVYGSTFFMLTGFHGLHVTVGSIMLAAVLGRSLKGHFTPQNHFAFEAVAWYWHFVDVVWLGLFIFVYIM